MEQPLKGVVSRRGLLKSTLAVAAGLAAGKIPVLQRVESSSEIPLVVLPETPVKITVDEATEAFLRLYLLGGSFRNKANFSHKYLGKLVFHLCIFKYSSSVLFCEFPAQEDKEKQIAQLERMLGRLTVENEFLKQVYGHLQSR